LTACEIHELSQQQSHKPSQSTALHLSNAHQMRWIGGNISGEGPQLILLDGHNHHIAIVGTTLYTEFGVQSHVLMRASGKVSGLSAQECEVYAAHAIFGGEKAEWDEITFHCKPTLTASAKILFDSPGGSLTNSMINCDGLDLRLDSISKSILINPGKIEAKHDTSLKVQ
jgi:hypothetical protein